MHSYAVNVSRWKITGVIAILAVIIGGGLNAILQPFLPSIVSGISPFALFTAIWFGFDRYLWRAPVINRIARVPNISGTWEGEVRSSHSEDGTDKDVLTPIDPDCSKLTISQTWTKIEIQYKNPGSSVSHSDSASFDVLATEPELKYTYQNKPVGDGLSTPQTKHEGTASIRVEDIENGQHLVGTYYTDEERSNYGSFRFKRN